MAPARMFPCSRHPDPTLILSGTEKVSMLRTAPAGIISGVPEGASSSPKSFWRTDSRSSSFSIPRTATRYIMM